MGTIKQRKILIVALFSTLLLLFLGLASLNAFRLSFLSPTTEGRIVVFTAISVLAFLLFLTALLLLVRNALKLYAEHRSRVLGSRLRTRMLLGAVLLSLVPITCMYGFSYLLINRAVERWFSQPAAELRDDSSRMGLDLQRYVSANARAEASSIAEAVPDRVDGPATQRINAELRRHEATLQGGFVLLFQDEHAVVRYHAPEIASASVLPQFLAAPAVVPIEAIDDRKPQAGSTTEVASGPLDSAVLQAARNSDDSMLSIGGGAYVAGSAWTHGRAMVVVALPLPASLSDNLQRLRQDTDQYWSLFRARRQIRGTFMLLLLMVTAVALFCASWLALHMSKQVTRPVEALADAMNAVAQGNYDRRVDGAATEELGELVNVFNSMAGELSSSRQLVEQSTVQVVAANTALEARRLELETMLQTIPNGVVMLDAERRILVANRAFCEMLDPGGQRSFVGDIFDQAIPAESAEIIDRLLRRSHRMSTASGELEMASPSGTLNIAATVALMEVPGVAGPLTTGYVVVLENATELLRAQKQSAWKEVARRVAHEIKNPLTPISLSAEQIQRHIGRIRDLLANNHLETPSTETIRHSSEVISSSVESMRSLVDQFASLAEFPNARPRPADLNTIVQNTLALFAGRLQGIKVTHVAGLRLPLVMADPEAMKRALSNLIDNAAEAMTGSLLREIRVTTALSESAEGMVQLSVADTGPGVTDEMRERLFLPYFSTKQRGTGLGLTIVSKIVAEHHGTIHTEKNTPSGARFVIELPIAQAPQERDAEPVSAGRELAEAAL